MPKGFQYYIKHVPSVKGTDGYPHMPRAKFPKMGDSLPRTPMNHHAKFDAASFILDGEIRNRTSKQKTNSKRYIHTLPVGMCE